MILVLVVTIAHWVYGHSSTLGVQPGQVKKVEALVEDTLCSLARDGLTAEAVESALNTMEFQLREFNTGSFPRGLSLMLAALKVGPV